MRVVAIVVALVAGSAGITLASGTPERTATLLAAGDIASCSSPGASQTAAILARQPGTIAALGDLAYPSGTAQELRDCYGPTWGRFRSRTRAALGNHEYATGSAAASIAYFHLPASGWYSYELGAWHVIVLNSNCQAAGGCEARSPQWRWLRADLAAHPTACALAYWHHARWSAGLHGNADAVDPLWRLLVAARADVVLSGHDHDYERFAPIGGITEFVAGTGGASHYPLVRLGSPPPVAADAATFGVLRLTLRPKGYDWRFLPVAGATYTDAGSAACSPL